MANIAKNSQISDNKMKRMRLFQYFCCLILLVMLLYVTEYDLINQ